VGAGIASLLLSSKCFFFHHNRQIISQESGVL
jgi:hypothetical protein